MGALCQGCRGAGRRERGGVSRAHPADLLLIVSTLVLVT